MVDELADPSFPPLLAGHPVAASEDVFETAAAAARDGRAGAGDLFWSQAANIAAMAVVLEPEGGLGEALKAHYTMMVAFADALGAIAPPEVAVHYRWPDRLLVNGGEAGRCRFILPADAGDEVRWMVVGFEVALLPSLTEEEPGQTPDRTHLWQEGCGEVDRTRLIESASRHFLAWIDTLLSEGFRQIHDHWTGRREEGDEITIYDRDRRIRGAFKLVNAAGDLVFMPVGGATVTYRLADQTTRLPE